jgi:ATP-dependent DNA helicase RecQ
MVQRIKHKKSRNSKSPAATGSLDGDLFETLRRLRKQIADDAGIPPYIVFSDATLRELARIKPATLSAFRNVSGVGDVKLERYGEAFVAAIRKGAA